MTRDRTNNAQALKTTNISFIMGIAGTKVTKEALDIIIIDDNSTLIIKVIAWGRMVNNTIKKFLQVRSP
jgi:magnesium-transporting ATPase (P-type)